MILLESYLENNPESDSEFNASPPKALENLENQVQMFPSCKGILERAYV